MQKTAARRAAVFSLSAKTARGGGQTPPSRARVNSYLLLKFVLGEEIFVPFGFFFLFTLFPFTFMMMNYFEVITSLIWRKWRTFIVVWHLPDLFFTSHFLVNLKGDDFVNSWYENLRSKEISHAILREIGDDDGGDSFLWELSWNHAPNVRC